MPVASVETETQWPWSAGQDAECVALRCAEVQLGTSAVGMRNTQRTAGRRAHTACSGQPRFVPPGLVDHTRLRHVIKATMVTGLLRKGRRYLAKRSNGRYELFGIGEDGTSLSPSMTEAAGDDPIVVHVLSVRWGWITEP